MRSRWLVDVTSRYRSAHVCGALVRWRRYAVRISRRPLILITSLYLRWRNRAFRNCQSRYHGDTSRIEITRTVFSAESFSQPRWRALGKQSPSPSVRFSPISNLTSIDDLATRSWNAASASSGETWLGRELNCVTRYEGKWCSLGDFASPIAEQKFRDYPNRLNNRWKKLLSYYFTSMWQRLRFVVNPISSTLGQY